MESEKTHLENGKVVIAGSPMSEGEENKKILLLHLRVCAEQVSDRSGSKEEYPAVNIPDNCCRLEPGTYTGEELGAVIYFIADMLE